MPDVLLTALLVAAIFVLADVIFAGGAMTMSRMSAMAGAVAHPLTAGALVILALVVLLMVGGGL